MNQFVQETLKLQRLVSTKRAADASSWLWEVPRDTAALLLQPGAHRRLDVPGSWLHYRSNQAEENIPHTRNK